MATAMMNCPRRNLFLMCAINAAVSELPSVLYVTFGVTQYNDRWCHPSRLGWVQGVVQSLATAPGAQAWLLLGADAAASVAYCTALFVVRPDQIFLWNFL